MFPSKPGDHHRSFPQQLQRHRHPAANRMRIRFAPFAKDLIEISLLRIDDQAPLLWCCASRLPRNAAAADEGEQITFLLQHFLTRPSNWANFVGEKQSQSNRREKYGKFGQIERNRGVRAAAMDMSRSFLKFHNGLDTAVQLASDPTNLNSSCFLNWS